MTGLELLGLEQAHRQAPLLPPQAPGWDGGRMGSLRLLTRVPTGGPPTQGLQVVRLLTWRLPSLARSGPVNKQDAVRPFMAHRGKLVLLLPCPVSPVSQSLSRALGEVTPSKTPES